MADDAIGVDVRPDAPTDSTDPTDPTGLTEHDEGARSPFDRLLAGLHENAGVESVYGPPIERGDRTVVPIVRVVYGFGGGFGEGEEGTGSGGGGGLRAIPAGALEVTETDTRFVGYGDRRGRLGLALAAFLVGFALGRRR
jgi:uncharacterized spore protein YtfJ